MKVNLNAMNQNNFVNAYRVNQSIANQTNKNNNNEQFKKVEQKDSITISPQGKANSLLERLMKQKMDITEQKNEFISSSLEKGNSMDSIKSQIESYDEQLKNIDQQISDMMTKEMEKQTEKAKEKEENEPKTEEEIQNERLKDVTNLTSDLSKAQTISSVKNKIDGEIKTLKIENKLDGGNPSKESQIAKLEKQSSSLANNIASDLIDISEKANEMKKPEDIEEKDEDKNKENKDIDEKNKDLNKDTNSLDPQKDKSSKENIISE